MHRRLLPTLLAVVLCLAAPHAQAQRIVFAVNDDAITDLDIRDRIGLIVLGMGGQQPSPQQLRALEQQVVNTLIDEALMNQAAERDGIEVTNRMIDERIGVIAQQTGAPVEQLRRIQTLRDQVAANIGWGAVVARRGPRQVNVSEEEIRLFRERLRDSAGKMEYRISEILLPIDTAGGEAAALAGARDMIAQIRSGAPFAQMAAQFSVGPGASRGGDLGWQVETIMDEETLEIVRDMQPGTLAEPYLTPEGVRIIALAESRRVPQIGGEDGEVSLRRIILPQDQAERLNTLKLQLEARTPIACSAFDALAEELDAPAPEAEASTQLSQLPTPVRAALGPASIGDIVAVEPLFLVVLCSRSGSDGLPDREQIETRLREQKLQVVEQRMMRDLRRQAVIRQLTQPQAQNR